MSDAIFDMVALSANHNRTSFCCGTEALDRYFKQQVTQDTRRRVANCFIAIASNERIAGFYTLASASIMLTDLPPEIQKKLPRYPNVPTVRMGRLAVDQEFKGMGLGSALLTDAILRAKRSDIAAFALIVDAKDDQAAKFYQHNGMLPIPDSPLKLFLPL
jgi:ribosomal protein S18 acetylase RimI-like enzyme